MYADLNVLRGLAAALRLDQGRITITVANHGGVLRVSEICTGQVQWVTDGLAIDISMTTLASQFVDVNDGWVLATATLYNQQIRRGAGIIHRVGSEVYG